jgi:hypothetical protein
MDHGPTPSESYDSAGNPDEANFLRHVAGGYDRDLGQLCSRCGAVLDAGYGPMPRSYAIVGKPDGGFRPGEVVLVSTGGAYLAAESVLKSDRDRSDEADCESIL